MLLYRVGRIKSDFEKRGNRIVSMGESGDAVSMERRTPLQHRAYAAKAFYQNDAFRNHFNIQTDAV